MAGPDIGPFATDDRAHRPCQEAAYVRAAAAAAGWNVLEAGSAVVPLRRIGPWQQVVLPPFAPYSSVQGIHDLRELETHADDLVVHMPPSFEAVSATHGWQFRRLETYLLDPAVAADPSSWSRSTARNFRQHAASYDVAEAPDASDEVVRLVLASYKRARHRPPLRADRIAPLARQVMASGAGRCFVARDLSGDPAAGVVLLSSGTRTSYWLAGSHPGPSMTVLLGSVLPIIASDGFREFDFVGANTPSIAEFKRRFGGERVPYVAARCTPNPWLRSLLAVKRRLRG